jgi:RimJ/RimL family protein N-acetyltransferase
MEINLRPILESEDLILYPLQDSDLELLYEVASDPKIWEQHPNKDRWREDVFRTFFEGAIQSDSAFKIVEKATGKTIGSTRFYDYDQEAGSIFIGYTFYGVSYWGGGVNLTVKTLMLDYIFQFVKDVYFHIGAGNIRSQIAISRLGAEKVGEEAVEYFGEVANLNYVYKISRAESQ